MADLAIDGNRSYDCAIVFVIGSGKQFNLICGFTNCEAFDFQTIKNCQSFGHRFQDNRTATASIEFNLSYVPDDAAKRTVIIIRIKRGSDEKTSLLVRFNGADRTPVF